MTRIADLLAKRTFGNGRLDGVSEDGCRPASGIAAPVSVVSNGETSWQTQPELENPWDVATARIPTPMRENTSTKVQQSWQRYRFF